MCLTATLVHRLEMAAASEQKARVYETVAKLTVDGKWPSKAWLLDVLFVPRPASSVSSAMVGAIQERFGLGPSSTIRLFATLRTLLFVFIL